MTINKTVIQTDSAPAPVGSYSQAIRVGNHVYFAGQIGIDPATGRLVTGGAAVEVAQVFHNIEAVAKAAGGHLSDIVSLTVYLQQLSDMQYVNEAIRHFFILPFPARTGIQAAALPLDAAIEITAVMHLYPLP